MSTNYQVLVEVVNQVEHDQSYFESELGNELPGALHAELVGLGAKMVNKFKKFVDMGKFFAEQQQPDVLSKIVEAAHEYEQLLMPPKVFGGYCPCLKPARSGPEYEKRYLLTRTKVVASTFLVHAILIESRAEKINMESMHFADYTNKMNNILNALSNINTKGSDAARENARTEILTILEMINKFMKSFEEETNDFRAECRRRLASTNELLTSHPEGIITRRILVKGQSSLQEIMNSSATVSMQKSKEAIIELDMLAKELKEARIHQVDEFNALEGRMHASDIVNALYRLREDMEIVNTDANSKIRDSLKRWNTVKTQSSPRPVAEYTEESEQNILPIPLPGNGGKIISNVGKELKGVGKDIHGEIKNITKIPSTVAMEGKNLVVDAFKLTTGAVDSGVNFMATGASKTVNFLGGLGDNNGSNNNSTNYNNNTSIPRSTSSNRVSSSTKQNSGFLF